MIAVKPVTEPSSFDEKARRPGQEWLARNTGAMRPRALWAPFLPDLEKGFRSLCGYGAMLVPTGGTVDHYRSYKHHPHLTYEWSNYRFASSTMNSIKRNADDSVLDPYEVGAGWFEIILPSLQMRATPVVPENLRERAEATLDLLKLRHDERIIRWRRSWYALYQEDKLTLEGLDNVAPLIAEAVRKSMM